MAVRDRSFAPEQAVEAVLYLAERLAQPTLHEVLKLRYFADKIHLANYGFLPSGDNYVAMKFGPVASNTYNLLKAARGDTSDWIHPYFHELTADTLRVVRGSHRVIPLRHARLEHLAETEVEALDQALRTYGGLPFEERTEISHDAAWEEAWEAANEAGQGRMSLESIAAATVEPESLLEHLRA